MTKSHKLSKNSHYLYKFAKMIEAIRRIDLFLFTFPKKKKEERICDSNLNLQLNTESLHQKQLFDNKTLRKKSQ